MLQDVRYAWRTLAARPGFTIVATLTLAIAIGANTAIYTVVDATLLRPLPFAAPERLMSIFLTTPRSAVDAPGGGGGDMVWSYPKYATYRDAQRSFASLALHTTTAMSLTGREEPERVAGEQVGAAYLRTLGITPPLGRGFLPEEDSLPGTRHVVVLGDALWSRQFAADPKVIGTTVMLDARPYTVVGVAPPGFTGVSGAAEFWVPVMSRPVIDLGEAFSHEFNLVGRLAPGVTPEQAAREAAALGRVIDETHPAPNGGSDGWGAGARLLEAERVDPAIRRAVLVLFAAVRAVLLIACANLANLQLARAESRQREVAVRLAVGASRAQLVGQLLMESVMLALLGAVAGVLLAWLGVRALAALDPASGTTFGRPLSGLSTLVLSSIRIDGRALVFTLVTATATAILFGLVPALRASRVAVTDALKGADEATAGRVIRPLAGRGVLVATEIALALILLIGAGLTMKSLARLLGTNIGVDPRRVLTVRVSLPQGRYAADSSTAFFAAVLERLRAIPGVRAAALGNCAPLARGCNRTTIGFLDRPAVPQGEQPAVGVHFITPGYLQTLRVPLLRGRDFATADRRGAPKVVLINDAAAKAYWPGADPIGHRVAIGQGGFGDGAEIIGVIGDVRFGAAEEPPKPDVFISYGQAPRRAALIFLRTDGDPAALAGPVRQAISGIDATLPVYDVKTLEGRVAAATARSRFSATLLAVFASIALVLAAVGVYGVMAYDVTQRTREIGIRMALGAGRGSVLGLIVRQGLAVTAAGIVFGLAGALAATRVLAALLYEVTPTDPATFVSLALGLAVVGIAASLVPALRATRVSPLVAIRD
jgi:predicted permease